MFNRIFKHPPLTFLHARQSDLCPALNNPWIVAVSVIRASAEHLRRPDLKQGICAALQHHTTCERNAG